MEFPRELKNPIQSGNFTFYDTSIEGVKVVDVKLYGDARGGFMETYREENFVAGGIEASFVQDNQSYSVQGVLRGLHFQIEHPQAKLVRVISGTVFDVAVDLREGSPTWASGRELSCPLRTAGSSLFLAALPTAFWSSQRPLSSVTSVTTSIIQAMRAASCGTIQSLALSGQHFLARRP